MKPRLLGRYVTGAHLLRYPGVVGSQLLHLAVSQQVSATIPHVAQEKAIAGEQDDGSGGPHPLQFPLNGRPVVEAVIELLQHLFQNGCVVILSLGVEIHPGPVGGRGEQLLHGLDYIATGHLPCLMPSHAVGRDQQGLYLWGDSRRGQHAVAILV